jgi:methionine-rich copper-binding protein CopC
MKLSMIYMAFAMLMTFFSTSLTSCSQDNEPRQETNYKTVGKVTQKIDYRFNDNVLKYFTLNAVYTDQSGNVKTEPLNEQTMQFTSGMYQFQKEFTFNSIPQKVKLYVSITPKAGYEEMTANDVFLSSSCSYTLTTTSSMGFSIDTKSMYCPAYSTITKLSNLANYSSGLTEKGITAEHNFSINKSGNINDNK